MDTKFYRDTRDRQRGINRKEMYGSDRAFYPLPSKLSSRKSIIFGNTGALLRTDINDNSTTNYDNFKRMTQLSDLLVSTV